MLPTIVLLLLLTAFAVVIYNGLVAARQQVREAWSSIDVQLQRRSALIPNLVDVVKGYAEYERETMKQVVEARSALTNAANPRDAAAANDSLTGALEKFFVLAEAYPNLKANERYAQLQTDLADTENKIAYARNYYNGAVELYNVKTESFPGVLIARAGNFQRAEFFGGE